jgi:PleD family two-component response regulator
MGVARRPTAGAQRVVAVDDSPPFQRRSTPLRATAPRRGVVLLVDDQPLIGEAVRRMLAGEDSLDFHYCREPASALTRAAEISPTVVLLDLVMPDVDGLEVLRRMRADERFQDLPIIVLSTKEEPAVKAEAFALGANDYLVNLPDRIEQNRELLRNRNWIVIPMRFANGRRAVMMVEKGLVGDRVLLDAFQAWK